MDNEIFESSSPVFTRTSTVSRKAMVKEISGSLSPVTGTRSFDLNFDSGSRGDREGEIQKSSMHTNALYPWLRIHISN
jgi:hypothetical protein